MFILPFDAGDYTIKQGVIVVIGLITNSKRRIIAGAMKDIILALISGLIMGGIFSLIKLPIPAPSNFAGVMGIVGIFLGYLLVKLVIK
jgi:XapX domain-containing protein